MNLRILSDLHHNQRKGRFELKEVEHDVLVCVGDVRGSLTDGIEVLGRITERPVVFIGGSHEFYGFDDASLEEAYDAGREKAGKGGPVHLLKNKALVLDGVWFLRTTLWTDYALYGEEHRKAAMEVVRHPVPGVV